MKNKFKGDREEEKRREEDKRKCDLSLLALQYFQAFRFLCWKERERERATWVTEYENTKKVSERESV